MALVFTMLPTYGWPLMIFIGFVIPRLHKYCTVVAVCLQCPLMVYTDPCSLSIAEEKRSFTKA